MNNKKEECGLVGIVLTPNSRKKTFKTSKITDSPDKITNNAAALAGNMLQTLQHRGEEAAGIVFLKDQSLQSIKGLGYVSEAFKDIDFDHSIPNYMAIAHTRYSVTGVKNSTNIQPILFKHSKKNFAIAHNGNFFNSKELKKKLEKHGKTFSTAMDTEILIHLITLSKKKKFKEAMIDAVKHIKGSFSLLVMSNEEIFALRDPWGVRPLCWGKKDGTLVVASETCALDLIGAKYWGQVHPGQILTLTSKGKVAIEYYHKPKSIISEAKCIFEMVYFSRPDSMVFGESIYQFRKLSGKLLAKESPISADIIVPVPDSGMVSALGFSEQSKIPIEIALTRNHYVGRSFIKPTQENRDQAVKMKLNPIKNIIHKKRVVLVDDSIVRGTTTKKKIEAIRQAGASEVHLRVASPPVKHGCFYGIDFPDEKKLIANQKNLKQIQKFLMVDSLAYLSVPGLLNASKQTGFCTACFTGKYPLGKPNYFKKEFLE